MPGNLAALLGLPAPVAAAVGALQGPADVRRLVRAASEAPGLAFLKPRAVSIAGRETFTANVDLSPAGLLRRAGAVGGRAAGSRSSKSTGPTGARGW